MQISTINTDALLFFRISSSLHSLFYFIFFGVFGCMRVCMRVS